MLYVFIYKLLCPLQPNNSKGCLSQDKLLMGYSHI